MAAEAPIYTLGALLRSSAASHADSPALIFPDRKVSYRKLNESARAWARTFIALGIKPGDNVGILLTTRPEFVELMFGIVMAGAVAVSVNARHQASVGSETSRSGKKSSRSCRSGVLAYR